MGVFLESVGNELCDGAEFGGEKAHDASDGVDGVFCLEGAEGGDLGDVVCAVGFGDVLDDLGAPVHAEIDVEVRHADAFGVEETFKEQGERERVDVGDGHGVCDEGTGARTTSGAYGDAVFLGPVDEVPHDEEVSGEIHFGDDVDFSFEPFSVDVFIDLFSDFLEGFEPHVETASGDFLEVFVDAGVGVFDVVCFEEILGHVVLREEDFPQSDGAVDGLGDTDGIFAGFRGVAERGVHFLVGFEVEIIDDVFPEFLDVDDFFHAVADEHGVCEGLVALHVVAVIGGDEREVPSFGIFFIEGVDAFLHLECVVHHFEIELAGFKEVSQS